MSDQCLFYVCRRTQTDMRHLLFRYLESDHPKVDRKQVWVDLVYSLPDAMRLCKAFLRVYVDVSTRVQVTLGPEEEVVVQAVRSSRSLNTFWKSLIAAADAAFLVPLRSLDRVKNHHLMLKRPTNMPGSIDEGPVSDITHWIYGQGGQDMKLTTTSSDYAKVEFTVTDIALILKTLWLSADLVPFRHHLDRIFFPCPCPPFLLRLSTGHDHRHDVQGRQRRPDARSGWTEEARDDLHGPS